MKKALLILLLVVTVNLVAIGQPGFVRNEIERAVTDAVEGARISSNGHFYAKCRVERRWLNAYLDGHPTLTLVAVDDTPQWYQFWRKKGVHGFWFDIKTGSNLGLTSHLDKQLLASMRRALLNPQKAPIGSLGDSVLYCSLHHVPYNAQQFNRWMSVQRDIEIPWLQRHPDGTLSLAFVTLEHSDAFRRKNNSQQLQHSLADARRPLAPYLVDFDWYNKTNFLLEADGFSFADSTFISSSDHTTLLKLYDRLLVWENGFFRGDFPLMQLPLLTTCWKEFFSHPFQLSIRALPLDEKKHRALLAQHEDSLFLAATQSLSHPATQSLQTYFRIYGKYGTPHTAHIEATIFEQAHHSMDWGAFYLQTYSQRQGRYYDSIDDVSFRIVLKDPSQAQTYRNLFPLGRHLTHADEIITFQKACHFYDPNIYLAKYPSGRYSDRFEDYFAQEEQRLYSQASLIYQQDNATDIENTLRDAVTPYIQHFPKGPHIRQVNEMYYYGIAVQRRNALLYSSHYSMRTPTGRQLTQIIASNTPGKTKSSPTSTQLNLIPSPIQNTQQTSTPDSKQTTKQQLLHEDLLALPLSQYIDYHRSDNGDFIVTSINISLKGTKKRPCSYSQPYSLTISYDGSTGNFFIPYGDQKLHQSQSLFSTIKLHLLDGYENQSGTLYDIEKWFLQNCPGLPTRR